MFFTERKLEARAGELAGYRYREGKGVELWAKEDTEKEVRPELPQGLDGFEQMKVGESWSGRDKYLWLKANISIPEEWAGKRILGIFDFGMTGVGNNSGFESLLYLDGKPYQGVDVNHKEVFLEEGSAGKSFDFTFRLWSGLEGGGTPSPQTHQIKRAEIAWLDEKTDDLFYMSKLVIDTIKNLSEQDPIRHELKVHLNQAMKMIDWSYPGSDEFYETVAKADDYLNEKIDSMDKQSIVKVKCIGHTHIDVAWLWRLKHTREKCSRSFSTVLRLMEQYPEYIFLQTQPQLYEYIKEDYPEIYEKMKQKIADGQWEVDGGMWVEADCNLTSGESLTRQFLIGSKFIKEEFGKDVEYLWLPDVFGYSWALPQILKKSGISTFMTTKISWNQYNRMPHDTFYWKGIDGTEILTHFITTPEPWSEPGSWFYTYNGRLLPKTVKGVWDAYSEKDITKELLISYGYGDGGGGVNRDMLETRRRINRIPGLPILETGKAGDYFRNLQETVKNTEEYVHTWDGELYLEYHRGTYTSHAYNKKMNRKMEFLYRDAEWKSAMAAVKQGDIAKAEQEELTKGWKILLTHQFHDIIPGSSIKEVYDDSVVNYEETEQIACGVETRAWGILAKEAENNYTIWNNSGWMRSELVWIEENRAGSFVDKNGNALSSQKVEGGYVVEVNHVPSMGSEVITFIEEQKEEASVFTITENKVETPFYHITLNEFGQITSIYDKENDREVIPEGQKANVLQMFEDKPLGNDAWDIDIFYQEKMKEITDLKKVTVTENGALRGVLHFEWEYGKSIVKQDMIVYAKDRRIDFKTYVDYHEVHQLMKAAFPVDIRSTYAVYDVQYGNVKRPNHWNTSWDQARFETVAHRWVDLSEHNYGVSLLNDCKYGHDIKGNVLRITLIKAATHPDYLQDIGEHEFTYSLFPHNGDFVTGHTVKEAYALNQPLTAQKGVAEGIKESFFGFDSEYVELDAIKQSEDKKYLVVRFHEYTGSKRKVKMMPGFSYQAYVESDLMERPIEEMKKKEEDSITVEVKPYEIKTYLFQI